MVRYSRIACLSTSRADAGIYRPLLRALGGDPRFDPVLITSQGNAPSTSPDCRVIRTTLHQLGDDPIAVAQATGSAVGKFTELLMQIRPDLVFVLGDRTEVLAAALGATICGFPIAHLHGGDTTRGAYDDACRHAITKLAHVHFPALHEHGEVIHSLGESRDRIHVVGALAVDEMTRFRAESIEVCSAEIGLDLRKPTLLAIYHPETISDVPAASQIDCVLGVIAEVDMQVIWIEPNADVGHGLIRRAVEAFFPRSGMVRLRSISQSQFWSCLAHCRALVGNSSAGIIEAASLKRPVVNVGKRQEGRVRPRNVIDVGFSADEIAQAIRQAASEEFHSSLGDLTNPYGDGHTAERILAVLELLPDRMTLLRKPLLGAVAGANK